MVLVELEGSEFSLVQQADLLIIKRSSINYQPVQPSTKLLQLRRCIDEIYTAHTYYGVRRIMAD